MTTLIMIIIGYLLGSISFGVILPRFFGVKDLRKTGSKNIGATNAMRVGGLQLAILVWLGDMLKATLAVLLAAQFGGGTAAALAGLAAVVGHIYPVFLKFKGGKGVAPTFGVMLVANPVVFAAQGLIWLVVAMTTRYSSLASIVVLVLLPVFGLFMGIWGFVSFLGISALCLWKHYSAGNIKRLIDGKESKIEWKWKK